MRAAAAAVMLVGLALGGQALADPTVEARQHFAEGVAHYDAGRTVQALEQFQEAYRLRAHPAVLVNIANCYLRLNRFVEATLFFERALSESHDLQEDQRRAIATALEDTHAHVGEILLSISPPGAEVRVDGRTVGRAPFSRPLMVPEGNHTLEARLAGHEIATHVVMVEARMTVQWRAELARASAETPPVAPAPTRSDRQEDEGRATLSVHGSQAGWPIRVEDVQVGHTPWEGQVRPGPARVKVGAWSGSVELAAGQRGRLEVREGRTPPDSRRVKVLLGLAVSGGLMAGALVTGGMALSAQSDFDAAADDIESRGQAI